MGDINLKAALGGQITLTPTNTASNYTVTIPAVTGTMSVQSGASFTQGSVIFAGTSGVFSQNNSQLFWDNTNNRLGIGTTSPTSTITLSLNTAAPPATASGTLVHAAGADGVAPRIFIDSFANNGQLSLRRANGTAASPSALAANDTIGGIYGFGYGATGYSSNRASISILAAEAWTDAAQGTYITFGTNAVGSAASAVEKMRLDSAGNLGLGVTPSAWGLASSGYRAVEVGAAGNGIYAATDEVDFLCNAYYSGGWKYGAAASTKATKYYQGGGQHQWSTAGNGTAGNAITFTQAMTLDASGRLGIGLTNQIAKLQVSYGTASMPSSLTTANSYLYLGGSDYGSTSNAKTAIAFGFTGNTATNAPAYFAYVEGTTSGNTYGDFVFYTRNVTTDTAPSERVRIDSSGNLVVTGSGVLGYGTGSGGTVTQATSKTTAVTLNKTSGKITMNNAALAASTTVQFTVNNTTVTNNDTIIVNLSGGTADGRQYIVWAWPDTNVFYMIVRNISAVSLSEALVINFAVIKGATS